MKKIDVSGWKKFKIEDVFMIKKPDVRSENITKKALSIMYHLGLLIMVL